jgi:thiol:disulfide interchange protein
VNKIISILLISLLSILVSTTAWSLDKTTDKTPSLIEWQEWSTESFAKAKKENKLVIMDLEAVWCHWCHVMDAKTIMTRMWLH